MKVVVPGQNVKIICRAVHSLAKVGDELFVEPAQDYLKFCTINTAQSAFAEFNMCHNFFSSFQFGDDDSEAKCKVTMRSCLSVFKNLHNPDKQVQSCDIRYKPNGTALIFQIKFTNSSVKKYMLPVIDTETIKARFDIDETNILVASSKFLSSCLKSFRHSEDEVTMNVTKEKTVINNHLELCRDNLMRTELSFGPSEFSSYTVNNATRITFCLKEFRAVLLLADPSNLPVTLTFTDPGRPIMFQVMNHPAYEAKYVVSTLCPSEMSLHSIQPNLSESQQSATNRSTNVGSTSNNKNAVDTDPFSFHSELSEMVPRSFLRNPVSRPSTSKESFRRSLVIDENLFSLGNTEGTEDSLKDAASERSNESEQLPSHLVQTVFARCFNNYNCLDSLPGNDIVLSQNSEFK